jgi:CheY-like chemotaxis protein
MTEDGADCAKRVLIVEDDVMIRMLIEDMLTDLGHSVTAQAARIEDAMAAAQTADIDLAILDINLNGQTTYPVAQALATRGTPFLFATGYGEHGMPDAFRDRPMLKKPFHMDGLKRVIDVALARNG